MPSPLDSYSIENKLAAAGFTPEQISRVISSQTRGQRILADAHQSSSLGVLNSPIDTGIPMAGLDRPTPETDKARSGEISNNPPQRVSVPTTQPLSQMTKPTTPAATPFDRMGQSTTPWGTPMRDLDVTKTIQEGEHSQQGPNGEGGIDSTSFNRALADFSAGLLAAGSQPGAGFLDSLGYGALNFLRSRDARESTAAQQAWERWKEQREMTREDRRLEHDIRMDERGDVPSDVEGYNWAVRNGQFDGSYLDWQKANSAATRAPQRPTDYDRKLAYYSNLDIPGMTPDKAQGLALDRYTISRHPVSQQAQVVDRVTGQIVGDNAAGMAPASASGAQGGGTPPQGEYTPSDPREATGMSGFWGNLANFISDTAGFGVPFKDVDEAGRALNQFKANLQIEGSADVPGRESNYVRELLGINAVTPFWILESDERAVTKLRTTERHLTSEIERMERLLQHPENFKPNQIATTRENLDRMKGLREQNRLLIQATEKAGAAGGDPEINSIVDKYLGPGPGGQ